MMETIDKASDEDTIKEWASRIFNSHLTKERTDNVSLIDTMRPLQRQYNDRMMSFQMMLSADRELKERQDREARQHLGISEERLGGIQTQSGSWEDLETFYRREAAERRILERIRSTYETGFYQYPQEPENDDQITW